MLRNRIHRPQLKTKPLPALDGTEKQRINPLRWKSLRYATLRFLMHQHGATLVQGYEQPEQKQATLQELLSGE